MSNGQMDKTQILKNKGNQYFDPDFFVYVIKDKHFIGHYVQLILNLI